MSTVDYGALACKYIDYILLSDTHFILDFKGKYTTERYMVMRLEPTAGGWIVVIDFKTHDGKLLIYSDSPYTSQYCEFTGHNVDGRFTISVELNNKHYTEYIDDNLSPDYVGFVKYCAIVNNGDDETMYSQLCGALMKCAIDMKA